MTRKRFMPLRALLKKQILFNSVKYSIDLVCLQPVNLFNLVGFNKIKFANIKQK